MAEFDVVFKVTTAELPEKGRADLTISAVTTKGKKPFSSYVLAYHRVRKDALPAIEKVGRTLAECSGVKIDTNPDGFTAAGITVEEVNVLTQAGVGLIAHLCGTGILSAAKK
jgi:hypothetical protein